VTSTNNYACNVVLQISSDTIEYSFDTYGFDTSTNTSRNVPNSG